MDPSDSAVENTSLYDPPMSPYTHVWALHRLLFSTAHGCEGTWVCYTSGSRRPLSEVAFKQSTDGNEGERPVDPWQKS